MAAVTGLGDPAVTIAVASVLFARFLRASAPLAFRWLFVVALCGIGTGAAKLALYIYGPSWTAPSLVSPSGHVAASILVYGALAATPGRRHPALISLAAATVALIAVSRVYLEAHSEADVLVGLAIGSACLACFLVYHAPVRVWPMRGAALLCLLLSLAGAALQWRLPVDPLLRNVAAHVKALGQV